MLVLTLALTVNATMFGIINVLFLSSPALVRNPEKLARISQSFQSYDGQHMNLETLSFPQYRDIEERVDGRLLLAGQLRSDISIGDGLASERVKAAFVTASYFDLTGVRARYGRVFGPADDLPPAGSPLAVLSGRLARRLYNSRDYAGKTLRIGGQLYIVIGELPEQFSGLERDPIDVWLPLSSGMSRVYGSAWDFSPGAFGIETFARLDAQISRLQAVQIVNGLRSEQDAKSGSGSKYAVNPFNPAKGDHPSMESRVALWLAAVSIIVIVIAAANAGSMQLVRALERRGELALRMALGASRRSIVFIIMLESGILTAVAGAISFVAAKSLQPWIARFVGLNADQSAADDLHLFVAMLLGTLAVGIVTASVPAFLLRGEHLHESMSGASLASPVAKKQTRLVLLAVQVALSTALLCGTGLFVESFRRAATVDFGFDPQGVLVADSDDFGSSDVSLLDADFAQLADALTRLPFVRSTAVATTAPFISGANIKVIVPGHEILPPGMSDVLYINAVTPDFFDVLGMRFVEGRPFRIRDPSGDRIAVVNQEFASAMWPGESAIGKCFHIGSKTDACREVVGVLVNPKRDRLDESAVAQFFVPLVAAPGFLRTRMLFVSVKGSEKLLMPQVVRTIQNTLPTRPTLRVRSLAGAIGQRQRPWRIGAQLFSLFSAMALIIAALGLYNAIFHEVRAREREIAIRIALGVPRAAIVRTIVKRDAAAIFAGIAMGIGCAIVAGVKLEPLLFHTAGINPTLYFGVSLVMATLFIIAAAAPLRRALTVAPAVLLRQ